MEQPIRLYLVNGFLGSGKTTFLQHILSQTTLTRVGVIVNEFGSVGIDGKLLQPDKVVIEEINNGSIFCACLKDGFVRTLAAFLEKPVDLLFVEASGMADPSSMERLLERLEPIAARKGVQRKYDYRGSICIVDAKLFPKFYDLFEPTQSQIQKSSFLVVNKIDTITSQELQSLHTKLRELRPDAAIFDTTFGQVSLDMLERLVHPEGSVAESLNTSGNRPATRVVEMDGIYTLEQIEALCRSLQETVIRCKGFFHTADGIGQVDNAGSLIRVEPVQKMPPLSPEDFCLVFFGTDTVNLEAAIGSAWKAHIGGSPVYYFD